MNRLGHALCQHKGPSLLIELQDPKRAHLVEEPVLVWEGGFIEQVLAALCGFHLQFGNGKFFSAME